MDNIYRDALEILGPNGEYWGRVASYDYSTDCYCVLGALFQVVTGVNPLDAAESYPRKQDPSLFLGRTDIVAELRDVIREDYEERAVSDPAEVIWGFNDGAGEWDNVRFIPDYAPVKEALEKAAARRDLVNA
jgi:hypothetical protein